jgi:hypothetical protein
MCACCRSEHIEAVHIPLGDIDKVSMQPYCNKQIFVLETENYDSMQAAVRLHRVLNFDYVTIVELEG